MAVPKREQRIVVPLALMSTKSLHLPVMFRIVLHIRSYSTTCLLSTGNVTEAENNAAQTYIIDVTQTNIEDWELPLRTTFTASPYEQIRAHKCLSKNGQPSMKSKQGGNFSNSFSPTYQSHWSYSLVIVIDSSSSTIRLVTTASRCPVKRVVWVRFREKPTRFNSVFGDYENDLSGPTGVTHAPPLLVPHFSLSA